MRFSKQWLQEWLPKEISLEQLLEQLPMLGHEIDSVDKVAGDFSGVIVAKVKSCKAHPNADRLRLCEVETGSETLSIVCGGKNVRDGLMVALAQVGAILPGDFKIKRSKIRGEASMGMLCSESELGLAESSDGIMELSEDAPIGVDLRDYLQLDDVAIEVDLTPNRGDCLSVQGIAREIAAKNAMSLRKIECTEQKPEHDQVFPINVTVPEACPLYVGRVIRNIDNTKKSPLWLQEKLRRSGLRSISPTVDVTNYVLLELGQPMHAFDLEKLSGQINVRYAKSNEVLTLLNEDEVTLQENTTVITDEKNVLAIAGVMGGLESGCDENSKHIFLESALFLPEKVAGIARQYGLHTDSSHRFERGVDPELADKAMERATKLLLDIVGGEAGPISINKIEDKIPKKQNIMLSEKKLTKVLGLQLPENEVAKIFRDLGMQVEQNAQELQVLAPTYRYDINHPEDLIEEVARLIGYDQIPIQQAEVAVQRLQLKETERNLKDWRDCLINRGYYEAITYSFVDPSLQQLLLPNEQGLQLANPISTELAVMRNTLWVGLLQAVQHNQNRQQSKVKLFELGKRFPLQNDNLQQQDMLAGVVTGSKYPEQWGETSQPLDFYDVKNDIEALLALMGKAVSQEIEFVVAQHPALHPGQSAKLIHRDQEVGWIGALHPRVQQKMNLVGPIYLFEVQQEAIKNASLPHFESISKFPSVRRDLALLVKKSTEANELKKVISGVCKQLLVDLTIFDIYQGKELPEGYKSIALALILQDKQRTLTDEVINELMNQVIHALEQQLQASLRM